MGEAELRTVVSLSWVILHVIWLVVIFWGELQCWMLANLCRIMWLILRWNQLWCWREKSLRKVDWNFWSVIACECLGKVENLDCCLVLLLLVSEGEKWESCHWFSVAQGWIMGACLCMWDEWLEPRWGGEWNGESWQESERETREREGESEVEGVLNFPWSISS
jgi:hypothetical protein